VAGIGFIISDRKTWNKRNARSKLKAGDCSGTGLEVGDKFYIGLH